MFGFIFEEQHLCTPLICLADRPIVVHFVVLSFLCHIWTYYYRGFPLVLLVVCQHCPFAVWFSVSISDSNDSFSFLIFFLNYFNFLIHFFNRICGFLCLFVLFFCFLFCSESSLLFCVLSLHLLWHCYVILFSFFDFHVIFVSRLLHLLIFVCVWFHFVSISFDFGYYICPFSCFLLLSLFHAVYCCGTG